MRNGYFWFISGAGAPWKLMICEEIQSWGLMEGCIRVNNPIHALNYNVIVEREREKGEKPYSHSL